MITNERILHPIVTGQPPAIALAAVIYRKWKFSLIDDLDHYHLNGVVISRPDLFGLAKVIELEGEPAWFIRTAVGKLSKLLDALPAYPIEWISFCRHKKTGELDERIRRYSIKRMRHLAKKATT